MDTITCLGSKPANMDGHQDRGPTRPIRNHAKKKDLSFVIYLLYPGGEFIICPSPPFNPRWVGSTIYWPTFISLGPLDHEYTDPPLTFSPFFQAYYIGFIPPFSRSQTNFSCTASQPCHLTSLVFPGKSCVNHHHLRRCKTSQTNFWKRYSPAVRNPTWHMSPRLVGDFLVSRLAFYIATPNRRPRQRHLTFSLPCVVTNTSHRLFTRVNCVRRFEFP